MSKFGNAHGPGRKITTGCFDSSSRRLITAGDDGTCKMWNFSNGQCLTELVHKEVFNKKGEEEKKPTKEVTKVICQYDPDDLELEPELQKMSYIISVGWDRKINIWADEKVEVVETNKCLPTGK